MKLCILINSNDSETVWNALRLGVFMLKQGDDADVFLLGNGVEYRSLNSEKFNITEMMDDFVEAGGKVHACDISLQLRKSDNAGVYEISTMQDFHELVRDSDKLLTFQ